MLLGDFIDDKWKFNKPEDIATPLDVDQSYFHHVGNLVKEFSI